MLISTPTGVVRDPKFFLSTKAIDACTEVKVTVNQQGEAYTIAYQDLKDGKSSALEYDKLIITVSMPRVPLIQGITTLQSIRDADYLHKVRDEKEIRRAVNISLIGVETCGVVRWLSSLGRMDGTMSRLWRVVLLLGHTTERYKLT